jgi:hypothetical protein
MGCNDLIKYVKDTEEEVKRLECIAIEKGVDLMKVKELANITIFSYKDVLLREIEKTSTNPKLKRPY